MERRSLKRCSTSSTDAVKRKKKKKTSVKKEMKRSLEEPTEVALPMKKKKTLNKWMKKKQKTKDYLLNKWMKKKQKTEDYLLNKWMSICVNGLDASLPMDTTKTALRNHFDSCGVITQVYVPIDYGTGAPKGCAHINMRAGDKDKALALDGSLLGGRMLQVRMASFGSPTNSRGCKTCPLIHMEGVVERFVSTHNGRFLSPDIEDLLKR
ncbi:hypothetical protein AALP_AA6G312300 [Arabis alpina]|uniref:RRM domain-containing protein n=1 Tax=Arabis alpina TaxID=50452 RepID=A0A087GSW1_ARAAL|nr:hypothetical protein AALP_AA6G312300 [Arabis alpina]